MKTKFTKQMFKERGQYLFIEVDGARHFVARFKHKGGPITPVKFKKELITNHYVEDYLSKLNDEHKAPFEILRENNLTWYEDIKERFIATNS